MDTPQLCCGRRLHDFARRHIALAWDEAKMAALYAEFAEEDRTLAEAGMADYAEGLAKEDADL